METSVVLSDIEEQRCTYHPNVRTRLRCSKCGTPICPRCAVDTPVGYRCPTCAAVRGLPTYQTSAGTLARAIIAGLVVALAVGILWGIAPDWRFYMALLLGFGVAESMAWAANEKRGADLQLVGMLLVIAGMILARAVMAERSTFFSLSMLAHHATDPTVSSFFQIRLLPDGLFAALALIIPWIRFK